MTSAADALTVVNYLNAHGAGPLQALVDLLEFYVDVNQDDMATTRDLLQVINFLNRVVDNRGEGESSDEAGTSTPQPALQVAPPHESSLDTEDADVESAKSVSPTAPLGGRRTPPTQSKVAEPTGSSRDRYFATDDPDDLLDDELMTMLVSKRRSSGQS